MQQCARCRSIFPYNCRCIKNPRQIPYDTQQNRPSSVLCLHARKQGPTRRVFRENTAAENQLVKRRRYGRAILVSCLSRSTDRKAVKVFADRIHLLKKQKLNPFPPPPHKKRDPNPSGSVRSRPFTCCTFLPAPPVMSCPGLVLLFIYLVEHHHLYKLPDDGEHRDARVLDLRELEPLLLCGLLVVEDL